MFDNNDIMQVCGDVCVQCDDNVRSWGGHLSRVEGTPQRLLRPNLGVHHLLHHWDTMPRFRAKGSSDSFLLNFFHI